MENKKISVNLSTFIMIAVGVGALILGIIGYGVYAKIQEKKVNEFGGNKQETIVGSLQTNEKDNNTGSSNLNSNNNNSSSSNLNSNNNNSVDKENNLSPDDITTKTSSKEKPLNIGEWGVATKYDTGIKDDVDIPVRVTNVTRGAQAAQIVKQYCESSTIYKYEDAKEGMEWAVVEYQVDLSKVKGSSNGKSVTIDSDIVGTGDTSHIKYNGYSYSITTKNITNDYTKENIATGQFAMQLPIGCTDYLIELGKYKETKAYFKGK